MNILNSALNHISTLIKNQAIVLETYDVTNVYGMAQEQQIVRVVLYAHIQPNTPFELKKYTDSTLDSNKLYKFFFSDENARILHSFNINLQQGYIIWDNDYYKIYALRDWYIQNGWVAVYATLQDKDVGASDD